MNTNPNSLDQHNDKIITFNNDDFSSDDDESNTNKDKSNKDKSNKDKSNKDKSILKLQWIHFSSAESCRLFQTQIASQYKIEIGALCCRGKGCVVKSVGANRCPTRSDIIKIEKDIRKNHPMIVI